jgi:hypothetical protein
VIEFRVVSIHHSGARQRMMSIGRSDPDNGFEPDTTSPYSAHYGFSRNQRSSWRGQQHRHSDIGSANGTRLNGYILTRNQSYRLRHGDELTFDSLAYRYCSRSCLGQVKTARGHRHSGYRQRPACGWWKTTPMWPRSLA